MENYFQGATSKTPTISFDITKGEFEISGRSIPENSIEFYNPLLEWLDQYVKKASSETKLVIRLEYFNTSSSKCLVEIFRKLEKIRNKKVQIEWYFEEEDEDMQESGEDFKQIIKIPFNMVMINPDED